MVGELREVFSDPLLQGEIPGSEELVEVADAAPNAAKGLIKLYRAYREQAARLSDLAGMLAQAGHDAPLASARLPMDEAREVFSTRPYFFEAVDAAAEAFHGKLNRVRIWRMRCANGCAPNMASWCARCRSTPCPISAAVTTAIRSVFFLSERLYPHDHCARWRRRRARSR